MQQEHRAIRHVQQCVRHTRTAKGVPTATSTGVLAGPWWASAPVRMWPMKRVLQSDKMRMSMPLRCAHCSMRSVPSGISLPMDRSVARILSLH